MLNNYYKILFYMCTRQLQVNIFLFLVQNRHFSWSESWNWWTKSSEAKPGMCRVFCWLVSQGL